MDDIKKIVNDGRLITLVISIEIIVFILFL